LTAAVTVDPPEPRAPDLASARSREADGARSAPSEAYIDGLRAVAVLSVMALHAWGLAAHPDVRVFGHSLVFLIARGGWGVELFFVLSGMPTLRTGDGEEVLAPGDVVFCPRGIAGLHTFTNPTDSPARVLAVSTAPTPEVVLYPEIGKVAVSTRSNPFEPVPEGGDKGIVAMFDIPSDK